MKWYCYNEYDPDHPEADDTGGYIVTKISHRGSMPPVLGISEYSLLCFSLMFLRHSLYPARYTVRNNFSISGTRCILDRATSITSSSKFTVNLLQFEEVLEEMHHYNDTHIRFLVNKGSLHTLLTHGKCNVTCSEYHPL